ncbi:hypothetical protein ACFSJ3_09660 [Corallincola platygyrae]|uniref:Uncharacterized protein n=1 Tax=Corallincola platygyrae TaxID=1193278 RepID=A0ABW4XL11_9GAMM
MDLEHNDKKYYAYSLGFMEQFAKNVQEVVTQNVQLPPEQEQEMVHSIVFVLLTMLDGSAHGGNSGNELLYPVLGFYQETEESILHTEDGSSMHEYFYEVFDRLYE